LLIDTHCHLDFHQFDGDREQVIARAAEAGISKIIVPAVDLNNCGAVIRLAERYDSIFAAVGVHPNSAGGWQDEWLGAIRDLSAHDKVVAIGEIGLDYYRDAAPGDVQRRAFRAQLELAAEVDLPVIVHNRQSDADVLRLLAESSLTKSVLPGVLHSFSSSMSVAERALEMGYYLGFTGPVTFKKSDDLRAIAGNVPIDRLLVETDAPFLAPQKYRGKRNEPAFVRLVTEQIAETRRLELSELARLTVTHAVRLFGMQLDDDGDRQ
jgi:TatD DNase family protein